MLLRSRKFCSSHIARCQNTSHCRILLNIRFFRSCARYIVDSMDGIGGLGIHTYGGNKEPSPGAWAINSSWKNPCLLCNLSTTSMQIRRAVEVRWFGAPLRTVLDTEEDNCTSYHPTLTATRALAGFVYCSLLMLTPFSPNCWSETLWNLEDHVFTNNRLLS
jgi:hypothetical protein